MSIKYMKEILEETNKVLDRYSHYTKLKQIIKDEKVASELRKYKKFTNVEMMDLFVKAFKHHILWMSDIYPVVPIKEVVMGVKFPD